MSKVIKINKGVDIKLVGEADKVISEAKKSKIYGLKPTDFHGVIPKLTVKEGDEVKAGSPLFFDKKRDNILFTSPVSGEVVEIKRGLKRVILEVKILADSEITYVDFGKADPKSLNRDQVKEKILKAGAWPFIIQRPYGVVANPNDIPRDIYISGFDSAPLAPDVDFMLRGKESVFQTGIDALTLLTEGKVHVGVRAGAGEGESIRKMKGIEITEFKGPHPAGNVGTQIHHTKPINKAEVVWVINPLDVLIIGNLFANGNYNAERLVALTGSEVKTPKYFKTRIGAGIDSITDDLLKKDGDVRIISGNVLTGSKVEEDGFLGFYDSHVTVIPEGNEKKFFLTKGWLAPGFDRFSISRAYPNWLMSDKKKYVLDTNPNGEQRAFVMTGEMEKVFPFDIFPMLLIKAVMINDIDAMEKLGIYEVVAEDLALCEFVCTSKINIQKIITNGLDEMRKEFA